MQTCKQCEREFDDSRLFCSEDGEMLKENIVLKGRYALIEKIGLGGMGFVYKARHTAIGHTVAIKILKQEDLSGVIRAGQRFEQEAKIIAQLEHDNIVRVVDFDSDSSYAFFVMEYLKGITLEQKIKESNPLSFRDISSIFSQICAAIEYAHTKGILHRDLKPSNIFLIITTDGRERVKVLDFGVAKILDPEQTKITKTLSIIGTPAYMSPEQFNSSKDIDKRSDIYSLGIILYQMICGKVPFESASPFELGYMHVNSAPKSISENGRMVSRELEKVVEKALAKRREDRPQSAEELAKNFNIAIREDDPEMKIETIVRNQIPLRENVLDKSASIIINNNDNSTGKKQIDKIDSGGGDVNVTF